MGCVSSTAAHEMPFDVVASVFDTWGRGGFNGPDAKANTEAFFSPDCYMSFSTNCGFKNSDMFKDYYGHAGMMEFTRRLLEMEFKDFTPTISAGEKGQVLVRATYTPTNKASGRTTDAPLTDLQEWTVVKGKVTKVVITHTEPKKMDATFFTNEEACGVVTKAIMAWGEGKFSDSNKASKESFKEFFTPDAVTVADADMKNTTGYKTYEGDTGFFEWIRYVTRTHTRIYVCIHIQRERRRDTTHTGFLFPFSLSKSSHVVVSAPMGCVHWVSTYTPIFMHVSNWRRCFFSYAVIVQLPRGD